MEYTENPVIKPHTYDQEISSMYVKIIQWGKNSLYSEWYWDEWIFTCKRMKVDSLSPIVYKSKLKKWIKDLNIRVKTVKFLKENAGLNLCDLELGNAFKSTSNWRKTVAWTFIKIKNFCSSKDTTKTLKR